MYIHTQKQIRLHTKKKQTHIHMKKKNLRVDDTTLRKYKKRENNQLPTKTQNNGHTTTPSTCIWKTTPHDTNQHQYSYKIIPPTYTKLRGNRHTKHKSTCIHKKKKKKKKNKKTHTDTTNKNMHTRKQLPRKRTTNTPVYEQYINLHTTHNYTCIHKQNRPAFSFLFRMHMYFCFIL